MAENGNSYNTSSISDILSWMVQTKEKHPDNKSYVWSDRDITQIKLGFSLMSENERTAFLKQYSNYRIGNILAADQDLIK